MIPMAERGVPCISLERQRWSRLCLECHVIAWIIPEEEMIFPVVRYNETIFQFYHVLRHLRVLCPPHCLGYRCLFRWVNQRSEGRFGKGSKSWLPVAVIDDRFVCVVHIPPRRLSPRIPWHSLQKTAIPLHSSTILVLCVAQDSSICLFCAASIPRCVPDSHRQQ